MAIEVDLYTCTADNKVLDKTNSLTEIASNVSIFPTSSLTLQKPIIILGYSESYLSCNYMKVTITDNNVSKINYYYAEVTSCDIGNKIEFTCIKDILTSNADGIKLARGTILRSESIGQPTLYTDSKFPMYPSKKEVVSVPFSNGANIFKVNTTNSEYCYVLCVMNGGANNVN